MASLSMDERAVKTEPGAPADPDHAAEWERKKECTCWQGKILAHAGEFYQQILS